MPVRRLLLLAGSGGSFNQPTWTRGTLSAGGSPDTIVSDGSHNAFPGLARLDGGRILLVWRRGVSHHHDGEVYGMIGTQTGLSVSWGSPFLIYTNAEDVRLEDGVSIVDDQVVVVARLYDLTANHDPFLIIADDPPDSFTSGTTWGSPVAIPLTAGATQNLCIGRVQKLQDDTYMVGFNHYSPASVNGVLLSASLTNWSGMDVVDIASGLTEIDVEEMPDGTLRAHLRDESPLTFQYATSSDHGQTWTAPASLYNAWGLPTFRRLPSGLQLAVHRGASDTDTYWRQSDDDGVTWSSETELDGQDVSFGVASGGTYASILPLDNTHALVVYGIEDEAQPNPGVSNLYSQVFTDSSTLS